MHTLRMFHPEHESNYMHTRTHPNFQIVTLTSIIILSLENAIIWDKQYKDTSCLPPTRFLNIPHILGQNTEKQSFTWSNTWRRQRIWGSNFILILLKGLNAVVMHISLETGTETMHKQILVLPSHEVVESFSLQNVLSFGPLHCNPKVHFLPSRLNILPFPWPLEMSFQLPNYLMKSRAGNSKSYALNPLSTAKYLKTTLMPFRLFVSQSYAKELNTSMFAIITSGSIFELDLSRFYP